MKKDNMEQTENDARTIHLQEEINSLSGELLRAYQEIHSLYRISEALGIRRSLEEIAQTLLDSALALAPARRGSVMLLEPGGEFLTVFASVGIPTEFGTHPTMRLEDSVIGEVIGSGKPLLINAITDHPRIAARLNRKSFLTSSLLSVPLQVAPLTGGQQWTLGSVNLADTLNEKGYFTSNELKLLTATAAQAALSIQNLRLISDLKEANEHNVELTEMTDVLFSQNSQLTELHKVGMDISKTDNVDGVCHLMVEAAVNGFGAGSAALLLLDDKSKELRVAAATGFKIAAGTTLGNRVDGRIIEALETGRMRYSRGSSGPLNLCGNSLDEWGLFPFKGRSSKLGVFVLQAGLEDISDSIAILLNSGATAIDTLLLNEHLQKEKSKRAKAEEHLKVLSGMLPICCSCKKIRDDNGYWEQVEVYVRDHSEAEFSHGICPECIEKLYGREFCDKIEKKKGEQK